MIKAKEASAISLSSRNSNLIASKLIEYNVEKFIKKACEAGDTKILLCAKSADVYQLSKELTALGYVVSYMQDYMYADPINPVTITISWD